jgi:putative FmdB family regulatory protein
MPTYEYACSACGNAWEEVQKITESPVEDCPKCHGKTAQRQISGGNFILKGGGWYADLYSSTGKSADKKAEGTAGTSGASGAGGDAAGSASSGSSSAGSSPAGGTSTGGTSTGGTGSSGTSSAAA